jgi:hypothetical protein
MVPSETIQAGSSPLAVRAGSRGGVRSTPPSSQQGASGELEGEAVLRSSQGSEGSNFTATSSQASSQHSEFHSGYTPLSTEDQVLHLANCVIRHCLVYGQPVPNKNQPLNPVVELWMDKRQLKPTLGPITLSAIDDGGLCRRVKTEAGDFVIDDNYVAILEAKKECKIMDGDQVIQDMILGQVTCQAMAVRFDRVQPGPGLPNDPSDDYVFVINAVQNRMRFFVFKIEQGYLDELKSLGNNALMGWEKNFKKCITVQATKMFRLDTTEDRKEIIKNVMAIVQWRLDK